MYTRIRILLWQFQIDCTVIISIPYQVRMKLYQNISSVPIPLPQYGIETALYPDLLTLSLAHYNTEEVWGYKAWVRG